MPAGGGVGGQRCGGDRIGGTFVEPPLTRPPKTASLVPSSGHLRGVSDAPLHPEEEGAWRVARSVLN